MEKTISYYIEKWFGYILAIPMSILSFLFINPNSIITKPEVFDKTIDVSGITFGFLLTVLTLLIQTPNSTVNILKKNNKFALLVQYNRQAVVISLCLCAFSLLLMIFRDQAFIVNHLYIQKGLSSLYVFLVVLLASKTYTFLKVFYIIIAE